MYWRCQLFAGGGREHALSPPATMVSAIYEIDEREVAQEVCEQRCEELKDARDHQRHVRRERPVERDLDDAERHELHLLQ